MDWTTEQVVELTRLWAEGVTTSEIGRRLGVSKNAVVSKAHRMHLAGRPSPIKRVGPPKPYRRLNPAPKPDPQRRIPKPVKVRPVPAIGSVAVPKPDAVARFAALGTTANACRWPIGHPGDPDYRTCTEHAVAGKPYCASHCAVAYQTATKVSAATEQHFGRLHSAASPAQSDEPVSMKGAA